jgi:branched-chain amino acid transport system permease protein
LELVLQYIVNGLLIGSVYALSALSIVIIYKSTQVFNFAVGEMMAAGMFIAWSAMQLGVPALVSIPLAVALMAAVGWLIERTSLRPLIGQPLIASVMATFALLFIMRALMLIIWRGQSSKYPDALPGANWQLGQITFSNELTWTFVIAIVTVIAVVLIFQRTKVGLGMRAAAEHQQLAQARGIPVKSMFSVTWMLSAAVCGIAGIFIAYRLGVSLENSTVGIAAFPAVLLGGLESIPGALVGGLIIGLSISLTAGLISPAAAEIAPFVILLLILLIKTEGLFGLQRIERI